MVLSYQLTIVNSFIYQRDFGHGFLTLCDIAEVCFKVSEHWYTNYEIRIAWNDPKIDIEWPIDDNIELVMADKDKNNKLLAEIEL